MQTKEQSISNFFERVLKIMNFYSIKNIKSFACDHLGYKSSEKINRLRDTSKNPSYEILVDISNKFEEINPGWLLTGKGDMLIKRKTSERVSVSSDCISEIIELATQLGIKIKENELLNNKNMELTAELDNYKKNNSTKVQRVPVQGFKDISDSLQNTTSRP